MFSHTQKAGFLMTQLINAPTSQFDKALYSFEVTCHMSKLIRILACDVGLVSFIVQSLIIFIYMNFWFHFKGPIEKLLLRPDIISKELILAPS